MRGPILAMVTVAMVACEATAFLLGPGASLQRHTPALKAASSKARVGVFGARKGPGFITKMVDENTSGTATLVKPGEAKLALSYFLKDEGATITATTGGVNNVVQYVDTSSGVRYVLRIYNNGLNTGRVKFEHAVLKALEPEKFSFEIPRYLPSLETGETFMPLPSGASCCLCHLIPGTLPKTADPAILGRSVGELMMGLGRLGDTVGGPGGYVTPPYYEVYKVHHACSKEVFYDYVKGPEMDSCRDGINTLVAEFKVLDERIEELLRKGLPSQLIHGDLHFDNVLWSEEKKQVTGLLDFEFAAPDWRAMEPAVCLSKYVGEDDPFPLVEKFIEGFCEYGRLTKDECLGLPDMINLRVMSNSIYFVGRALAGEDTIDALTSRADMYAARMVWVRENRQKIVDCISAKMAQFDPAF